MIFARPEWLALLPLVALLGWRGRRSVYSRYRAWATLGKDGYPPGAAGWRWLLVLSLTVLALARPMGRPKAEDWRLNGQDVVLAVDVSRSMSAQDAVPDRLTLAIESAGLILDAVGRTPGTRVGVVAFAGRGVVRCPLTENLGAVRDVLSGLRAGSVQPGGTDLEAALRAALVVFEGGGTEPQGGRTVVLLTDGEQQSGRPEAVLPLLRQRGIVVHGIAVGDAEHGHPIPLAVTGRTDGVPELLTYQGQVVQSRRDDGSLRPLAVATGGTLLGLGTAEPKGLDRLFADRIEPAARERRRAIRPVERTEAYRWPVLAAVAVSVVGIRFRRQSGALLSVAGLVLFLTTGAQEPTVARPPPPAPLATELASPSTALQAYEAEIRRRPTAALPRYNAAATLFALGRFEEAARRYAEARNLGDEALRARAELALGNTAMALGDPQRALDWYTSCLASALRAGLSDVGSDAEINRRFAQEVLDALRRRAAQPPEQPDPAEESPEPTESGARPEPEKSSRPEPSPGGQGDPDSTKSDAADRPEPPDTDASDLTTPEERLERAVENARQARRNRLEGKSEARESDDRRDW